MDEEEEVAVVEAQLNRCYVFREPMGQINGNELVIDLGRSPDIHACVSADDDVTLVSIATVGSSAGVSP